MKLKKKINQVTLGALLHDIGKFIQRGSGGDKDHSYYTGKFIEDNKDFFERAFGVDPLYVKEIAERHHEEGNVSNGQGELQHGVEIVRRANYLSSGHDRGEIKESLDISDRFRYRPIFPIFLEVDCRTINDIAGNVEEAEQDPEVEVFNRYCYRPDILDVNSVFPEKKLTKEQVVKAYRQLYSKFDREFKTLKSVISSSFDQNFEALKFLLLRHLWAVPSNTSPSPSEVSPVPDIPLADHLFTTAAIATALKAYHEVEGYGNLESKTDKKFVLLSVDFSGIQSFVFQKSKETKKWAAKILRARSFAVSLALEGVIRRFIEEFGVNSSVVFLNAGGKALLLLPNYSDAESRIEKVREEISRALLEKFYGQIKIKIAYVKLSEDNLKIENFQGKLEELYQAETEARFRLFGVKDFSLFVSKEYARKVSQRGGVCHICGVRPAENVKDETPVCDFCSWLIDIGTKLPKSKFALLDFKNEKWFPFPGIEPEKSEDLSRLVGKTGNGKLLISFSSKNFRGIPVKFVENYVPVISEEFLTSSSLKDEKIKEEYREDNVKPEAGNPKTFVHIAMESLREENGKLKGKPFLGVLKADVDKLGFIFISGFAKVKKEGRVIPFLSISRFAALSRMLDYFFTEVLKEGLIKGELRDSLFEGEDYVNYKRQVERYENIYSVFSGGDDLFLIGPWEDIIRFTEDMRALFRRYVCDNVNITLSAGVELLKPDLPIEFIADMGEEALDSAKKFRSTVSVMGKRIRYIYETKCSCSEEKDRLAFERFKGSGLGELLRIADRLEEIDFSTATLYKLLRISDMANNIIERREGTCGRKEKDGKVKIENLLWKTYLYYFLSRDDRLKGADRESVIREIAGYVEKFSENLHEDGVEIDNLFYIPLAIVIYRRRSYGGN